MTSGVMPDGWAPEAPATDTSPAIEDYALVGDCRTAALVSRQGSIDWLCLSDFSGPSVFAALLDPERGGHFALRPAEPFSARRQYLGASGVLETAFRTAGGSLRLTDLLPVPDGTGALAPMREVLRLVEGVEGSVVLDVRCEPRPDYGRIRPRLAPRGALGWP